MLYKSCLNHLCCIAICTDASLRKLKLVVIDLNAASVNFDTLTLFHFLPNELRKVSYLANSKQKGFSLYNILYEAYKQPKHGSNSRKHLLSDIV